MTELEHKRKARRKETAEDFPIPGKRDYNIHEILKKDARIK